MPKGMKGFQKGNNFGETSWLNRRTYNGENNPFYKKTHTKEVKEIISKKLYRGDNAGYGAIHRLIKKRFGKANKCENPKCIYPRNNSKGILMEKPSLFVWANKSGEYRRDMSDWWMLCQSCNLRDGIHINKRFL